jgi:hypothetical protein
MSVVQSAIPSKVWSAKVQGGVTQFQAERWGPAIEQMYRQKGGNLLPQELVEAARPANSPLHDAFEWDDQLAAEMQRLDRARFILRSIQCTVVTPPRVMHKLNLQVEKTTLFRAFVKVGTGPERGYVPSDVAVRDADLFQQVLNDAMSLARSLKQKIALLEQFHADVTELDDVMTQVQHRLDALKNKAKRR